MSDLANSARQIVSWDPVNLQRKLQKLGIPRGLRDRMIVVAKQISAPGQSDWRAKAKEDAPLPGSVDISQFKASGTLHFEKSLDRSAMAAAGVLRRLSEDKKQSFETASSSQQMKGAFLRTLASNGELMALREVRDFILHDEIVSAATHYLEGVPVLSAINLWWSPPNDTCKESQLYHYDGEDKTQLKIFLHVSDVDADCGPFTYIPADLSDQITSTKRRSARLDDALVEDIVGSGAAKRLLGPGGTTVAVDTSRCLHYGSRGNTKERLVVMAQFTRFLAPKAHLPNWQSELDEQWVGELDALRRSILNLT